jgi:hypothetical protein
MHFWTTHWFKFALAAEIAAIAGACFAPMAAAIPLGLAACASVSPIVYKQGFGHFSRKSFWWGLGISLPMLVSFAVTGPDLSIRGFFLAWFFSAAIVAPIGASPDWPNR